MIHVLIDTTFVHHKFRNQSTSQRSRFGSEQRKLVKAVELQGSNCRTTFNFARESLVIRMRTTSSSVSVTTLELLRGLPFIQCVAHCNAEFLQTILGLVLRLVGLILLSVLLSLVPFDQFRTEINSLFTTILRLIVDSRRSSAFLDVTLNSSMMSRPCQFRG